MSYVLIAGAKSDIARALAIKYGEHGYDLYLAGRNAHELEMVANDLRIRTRRDVKCFDLDLLDDTGPEVLYARLEEKPIGVISAVGLIGDQEKAQKDLQEARRIIESNYTGVVFLLEAAAADFERRKEGFIIGISSVAGDRGRKSNYFYGSAKAGLTAYLSGLRNRLDSANIQVLTVKPGFVATRMTMGRNLPGWLTARPDVVAADIFRAQQAGRNVLYTKWIWRWVMMAVKAIPERLFKRTSL